MRAQFEQAGGIVLEHTAFKTADLYRDAVVIQTMRQGDAGASEIDAQPSGAYHGLDADSGGTPAGEAA